MNVMLLLYAVLCSYPKDSYDYNKHKLFLQSNVIEICMKYSARVTDTYFSGNEFQAVSLVLFGSSPW